MKTFLIISPRGEIKTFAGDFPGLECNIKKKKVRRISHVVPKNIFLRVIFKMIRLLTGDKSLLAEWTRKWKCEWIVIMEDKSKHGPFKNRKDAIAFERKLYVSKQCSRNL
jgi:hypothetical protein